MLAVLYPGFYTLLNKDIGGKMPEVILLAYTMLFGIIFLLPGMAVR